MPACFGMAGVYVLAVPGGPVKGRKGETTNHFNGTTKKSTNRSSNNNMCGGTYQCFRDAKH